MIIVPQPSDATLKTTLNGLQYMTTEPNDAGSTPSGRV